MADKDLNKMAEELANTEAKDQVDQGQIYQDDPDAVAETDIQQADPNLVQVAAMGIHVGGGFLCGKARVTPLENVEVMELAEAMVMLAQLYGVGPQDPKTIAWLTLGGVVLKIVGSRERLPEPEPPEDDAPADPPIDDGTAKEKGYGKSASKKA